MGYADVLAASAVVIAIAMALPWAISVIVRDAPIVDAWWSIVGPIVMSVLLIRVSGVGLLEKKLKSKREGYEEYIERTNAFFRWPPRSRPD